MNRYRVEIVKTRLADAGAIALFECINGIAEDEHISQIIPFADQGWTSKYVVVIEKIPEPPRFTMRVK